MAVHNSEIAEMFNEIADLLELGGGNEFRVRAYRNASRTVAGLPRSAAEMVTQGAELSDLPGIGKDLAGKIQEIVRTQKLPLLEELRSKTPRNLRELMRIPGLGAKRIAVLRRDLGIETIAQLRSAAQKGLIHEHAGFGEKTERHILDEIEKLKPQTVRMKLADAEEVAAALHEYLRKIEGVGEVVVAGSYRRRKETVGDLDVLITCDEHAGVMDECLRFDEIAQVIAHGKTRSAFHLRSGLQVDIRVVPRKSFGAALVYFTGSKAHNIALRKLGVDRGLKINEYGVFRGKRQIAGATEKEIYEQVALPWIAPELREDCGEFDAARENRLPDLVALKNIRGDLHCHTDASDGKDDLETMAHAARERGYEYLAICDHSKRVAMANGLDTRRLKQQIKRIDRLNEKLKGIRLLKSIEVDILEDGSLDLPDEILKELDLTVCSVHYKLNLPFEKQTERVLRAMDNPYFRILGHPTGRLINSRRPMELDMEKILKAARERGHVLEVNAQPERLDLSDAHCKMAREHGVKLAISTDAHRAGEMDLMRFGVWQARRGWIEKQDVINTLPLRELLKVLSR